GTCPSRSRRWTAAPASPARSRWLLPVVQSAPRAGRRRGARERVLPPWRHQGDSKARAETARCPVLARSRACSAGRKCRQRGGGVAVASCVLRLSEMRGLPADGLL